jgi:hypothetical protein
MGAARERNSEKGPATAYVRISAEEPLNSASKQKAAVRRYAKTQKLNIALIRSDQRQTQLISLNEFRK